MKIQESFAAGETVAQIFERASDAQAAATRLRAAGFSDVRLSESGGRTTETHVTRGDGATEIDFAASLEQAGFPPERARAFTDAVARGAVLLTVAGRGRVSDAAAVLRGETVAAHPLGPVDVPVTAAVLPTAPAGPASAPPLLASTPMSGDRVVPLRAERLDIAKERTTSDARIRKEVVTEEKTITVPVQHEQLVVERDGERDVRIPLSGPNR